jgi:hypothetical protein
MIFIPFVYIKKREKLIWYYFFGAKHFMRKKNKKNDMRSKTAIWLQAKMSDYEILSIIFLACLSTLKIKNEPINNISQKDTGQKLT